MSQLSRLLRGANKIAMIARSLSGGRLIDPVEVFYEPALNRVHPILSKSGNSTLKLKLIQQYAPDYRAKFPGIHLADPGEITDSQLVQHVFHYYADYVAFCRNKRVRIVVRNPYERYYSFFTGVRTGRNILYLHPYGLGSIFRLTAERSWPSLLRQVCLTPDVIADRHFRSQSYYLTPALRRAAASVEILDMPTYLTVKDMADGADRLNVTDRDMPAKLRHGLEQHRGFQRRYRNDLLLYRNRTILPSPFSKY